MKRLKLVLMAIAMLLITKEIHAQNFYDISKIQEVRLSFTQNDWRYQLDTSKAGSEGYIIARSCTINGVNFDSVGVKFKGNSSYSVNNKKNPLHIELDNVKSGQSYQGYSDVKLSNIVSDPSFVREILSYAILSNYMHCPKANFAKVYINDTYYGIMTNVESINKGFLDRHFYSSKNTFVKCNPEQTLGKIDTTGQGGGPGGPGTPGDTTGQGGGPGTPGDTLAIQQMYTSNLAFITNDSNSYLKCYEMKSKSGWNDLINLIVILNKQTDKLESVMDIDKALWMLAFNSLLINFDSYTGAFAQNYYLYKNNYARFMPIVWDLNMSFGSFTMLDNAMQSGQQADSKSLGATSIFVQDTNTNRPLINKLLTNEIYRKEYLAHFKTMAKEFILNDKYLTLAQQYQSIIDSEVKNDTNKFYTYDDFKNNLTQPVSGGSGIQTSAVVGLKELIDIRKDYISKVTEFNAVQPTISNIVLTPAEPALNDKITISSKVSDAQKVYLAYRYDATGIFTKAEMLDDGKNGDQSVGDGIYSANVTMSQANLQYYIISENAGSAMFSPERAEYEFYNLKIKGSEDQSSVVVNEMVADNKAGAVSETGKHSDWIELYNNGDVSLDLSGYFLSDDSTALNKWTFPTGTFIKAHGYLTIFADDTTSQNELHAAFKLSKDGECVILSNTKGVVLDKLIFGAIATDVSMGRCPNGTGEFKVLAKPTFNSENDCSSAGVNDALNADASVYPNPFINVITLRYDGEITGDIKIYSQEGILVKSIKAAKQLDLSELYVGVYFVKFDGKTIKVVKL